MKTLFIVFLFLVTQLNRCYETNQMPEIEKIRFGVSFGMCLGYCWQEITLSKDSLQKKLIPKRDSSLEERTCITSYTGFDDLIAKIDLEAFFNLDEVIGCPDCADGGAEWIEIVTNKGVKKVTYSFEREPREVKSIINELRKRYDQLGECM